MKFYKITIYLLFISLSLTISCKKEKQEKDIIPKSKLIKILADIHIADALLTKNGLYDRTLPKPESLSYYNQIFKKYKITRKQFYKSFYYYMKDIQAFFQMYQTIYDTLNNRYQILDSLERLKLMGLNIWNKKQEYSIRGDTSSFFFKIKAPGQGYYTLSAKIKSFSDDLTYFPRMKIFVIYKDTISPKNVINITSRDNIWHNYEVSINTDTNYTPKFIAGYLIFHDPKTTYMHLKIKNIMLTYKPYEKKQKK